MTDIPSPGLSRDATSVEHYAARGRLLADALAANKAALFDLLDGTAITLVVVSFDGTGDSGQIEGVDAYVDEVRTPLPAVEVKLASVPWNGFEIDFRAAPLEETLEAVAYGLLEAGHDGWENNEGAFGEFSFDIAKRSIRLDFNQRIETSKLSVFEL